MPIYEYKCGSCSKVTDTIRPIRDRNAPISCRFCGAPATLILSTFSIVNQSNRSMDAKTKSDALDPELHQKRRGHDKGITIENVHIENANVGISVPAGAKLNLKGYTTKNVKKALEIRND